MNILVLSAWCPFPADNGSRLRAYHLLRELAAQGHCLSLIALGQPDSDFARALPSLEALCAGGVQLFPSRFFQKGTLKSWLGFLSLRPRMLLDTWQPDAAAAIARACQEDKHDIILALQTGIAHYVPASTPMPCVLDEVEVSSFLREWEGAKSLKKRLRLGLMVAKFKAHIASLGPRFACWTCVSALERQAVLRLVGDVAPPVRILPNGVDLEYNTPAPEEAYNPDTLIYNGALSFYANHEAVQHFVQDILPLIQRARPAAHLLVTGRADTLAPDDPLRHHPAVTLTGYVDDIRPVVRRAAVCVVPLRQGGGTRLKILEAMALGVPVVATPCGAEGIDGVDSEHLLIADAPVDFARATVRLMEDAALRARLAVGGRRLVEECYGWHAIGAHLAQILQEHALGAERVLPRPETSCP